MQHSWRTRLDIFSLEKEGKYLLARKKWKQAEDIFSQLIECGDVFWVYLAQSLIGQKKYQSALECFEKLLPKTSYQVEWGVDVFKGLGCCYHYLGDQDSAKENFNKALSLKKNIFDSEIELGLALILKEQKLYKEAEEKFQHLLEKNINEDEAWAGLAEVRFLTGETELAHSNLLRALDLNPENKRALKAKVRWSYCFQSISGHKISFSYNSPI